MGTPAPAAGLLPLFQGVDRRSLAYRMLHKMGWSEGQGLVRCERARLLR